jgi:Isocitrate/isopropylmalate dehydrogenase
MAKYRIAWMPGDGVGNDVMEATRIVLDRMNFDAEYVPCDIGWEFWCKEGNALPERTVKRSRTRPARYSAPSPASHRIKQRKS